MSVHDLVFKESWNNETIYDPLRVDWLFVSYVTVTNMGDSLLEDLGVYLVPASNHGGYEMPGEEPPETDYQDLLTWGSATDSGAAVSGGIRLIVPINPDAISHAVQVDASGGPSYLVETTDINDDGPADVAAFPDPDGAGDYLALGYAEPFNTVVFDIDTAGTAGVATWKYWDGAAWSALTVTTDDTNALLADGAGLELIFEFPTDWAPRTINGSPSLYFIIAEGDGAFGVIPLISQAWITQVSYFVTRTQGALLSNKIPFVDIGEGESKEFGIEVQYPPGSPARRLYVNLVLE